MAAAKRVCTLFEGKGNHRLSLSRICAVVAVVAAIIFCAPGAQADDQDFISVNAEGDTVPAIASCLGRGKEAVLLPKEVHCQPYGEGSDYLKKEKPEVPFDFDEARDCPANSPRPFNGRRLASDAIQHLLSESKSSIPTFGIRILGAIFCEPVNLVGLDLPFSLVLDKSVFAKDVEVRNVQINGDLTLDRSLTLTQFRILRSHIRGSLSAQEAFISRLSLESSSIDTSVSFLRSVLFKGTQINNSSIANEISIRGSALSYLIVQFSKIGEALDLSHSQARCAYQINKSEVGYFLARQAGFGTVQQPSESDNPAAYYVWREDGFPDSVRNILSVPQIRKKVSEGDTCINPSSGHPYRASFLIFDSMIKSSLCVADFRWLRPRDGGPFKSEEFVSPGQDTEQYLQTVISINGDTITHNLIIDLWPKDLPEDSMDLRVHESLHKLEVIGVKAGGLIIDFQDKNQKHVTTAIDGLEFERIYDAQASCEYGASKASPVVSDAMYGEIISDFTETLKLPTVKDALTWLELNMVPSSQPYTAFAAAFKSAGVDSTNIDVARENRALCDRAARWLPITILSWKCPDAAERLKNGVHDVQPTPVKHAFAAEPSGWAELGDTTANIPTHLSDLAQLAFRGGLYFLADHGYRPAKVLWWVMLTLVVFWVLFLWRLNVVAFTSKPQSSTLAATTSHVPEIKPLGFLFLFDRLLPAYQIDTANYEIENYFKRISISKAGNAAASRPVVRRLRFFEWPVERITSQRELERIERWLRALRLLGVVFAIFLTSAVGALVIH